MIITTNTPKEIIVTFIRNTRILKNQLLKFKILPSENDTKNSLDNLLKFVRILLNDYLQELKVDFEEFQTGSNYEIIICPVSSFNRKKSHPYNSSHSAKGVVNINLKTGEIINAKDCKLSINNK
jgi:hypothetical protein